jgi:hypothetical protein
MRVRSQWFKNDREKTPEEIAGAIAFITWRIAQNGLKNLRKAGFDIAVGPQYFNFLSEYLFFLIQVADRIAFRQFNWNIRVAFTTALSLRVAENLAENQADLLDGDRSDIKSRFIETLNQRTDDYAEWEYEEGGSNFAFLRVLGHGMERVMDAHDQRWVADQMMTVEAPEAVETLEKAMKNLLDDSPRPARSGRATGPE